ncbi:MAG: choice-of-anchor A family protein, partial [Oscillospiraceae bacterium]
MNGNTDKKRKIMQSLSAFAFALTVFAANAQGSASAETLDSAANGLIVKTAAIESADNEGGEGSVMGKTTDSEANGDDADDISTNYDEEENSEDGQSEDADFTDVDSDTDEDDEAETELRSEAGTIAFLGKAAEYNVFVENNFTVNGADCPGNFAVGGNVTVPESYSAYKTVVGGTILGGSFLNGYTTADAEGIDFAVEFANLRATSAKLAAMVPNGYVTNGDWGAEMKFVGTNDDINVFTMSVSEYNSILANSYGQLKFTFDVPAGSVAIVNITGEGYLNMAVNCGTYYAGQAVSNGTANNANILFNVPDAYGVSIGTSMGNLLAPNADVTSIDIGGHPHFEGQLICKNYEGVNEFGGTQFVPDDPTAPDKGDNGDTDPDNPDGGDSGNTDPDTPTGGDSGNANPDTSTGGDSGNTNPDTPTGGDSGNTNPDIPTGGDSGNTDPDTPSGGDSGNTNPDTPSGGDSG